MKLSKKYLKILFVFGCILVIAGITGIVIGINRDVKCTPMNVFLSRNGDNSIKVSWETENACLGYILYGDSSYEIERVAVNSENLGKSKEHSVVISNLLTTNAYYFVIVSDEQPYGNNGNPIAFYLNDIN